MVKTQACEEWQSGQEIPTTIFFTTVCNPKETPMHCIMFLPITGYNNFLLHFSYIATLEIIPTVSFSCVMGSM